MTCKEKLKQEHPELVDEEKYAPYGCRGCPSDYGYLDDPMWCDVGKCRECWERDILENIPWRFEYMACNDGEYERVYVTVHEKFRHHYTGEVHYRIREEGESGWVNEAIYPHPIMLGCFVLCTEG